MYMHFTCTVENVRNILSNRHMFLPFVKLPTVQMQYGNALLFGNHLLVKTCRSLHNTHQKTQLSFEKMASFQLLFPLSLSLKKEEGRSSGCACDIVCSSYIVCAACHQSLLCIYKGTGNFLSFFSTVKIEEINAPLCRFSPNAMLMYLLIMSIENVEK